MKYASHIALLLLMVGLMALALVLPNFVQTKDGSSQDKRHADYVMPESEPEMLPAYIPTSSEPDSSLFSSSQSSISSKDYLTQIKNQKSVPNYDSLLEPFLVKLQNGDLDGAENVLEGFGTQIPSSIQAGLQFSLDSARDSQKALAIAKAETAKAVHAGKEAAVLAKANEEKKLALASLEAKSKLTENSDVESEGSFTKLQSESAEKIKQSLIELNKATEAAKLAAKQAEEYARETSKLRTALLASKPAGTITAGIDTTPLTLPKGSEIQFRKNSSLVPSSAKSTIAGVAETLKKESRLGIQLRGYSDSVGKPEYNAILSRARSLQVQAALVKLGISVDRVDVLPFGASQSPSGSSADFRRVDLVFVKL